MDGGGQCSLWEVVDGIGNVVGVTWHMDGIVGGGGQPYKLFEAFKDR